MTARSTRPARRTTALGSWGRTASAAVGACVLAVTACAQPAPPDRSTAQRGRAVALDGRLADGEWEGADGAPLTGSGAVAVKQDAGSVYVAVRGGAAGWAHVYVPGPDTVRVLHASAALGTALYTRDGDGWRLDEPFAWAARDTTSSPAAEAARAAHWDVHGWLANTNTRGTGRVLEFRVGVRLFDPAAPRLAVLFAQSPEAPRHWPAGLADATLDPDLIRGTAPGRLAFEPPTWAPLDLDEAGPDVSGSSGGR